MRNPSDDACCLLTRILLRALSDRIHYPMKVCDTLRVIWGYCFHKHWINNPCLLVMWDCCQGDSPFELPIWCYSPARARGQCSTYSLTVGTVDLHARVDLSVKGFQIQRKWNFGLFVGTHCWMRHVVWHHTNERLKLIRLTPTQSTFLTRLCHNGLNKERISISGPCSETDGLFADCSELLSRKTRDWSCLWITVTVIRRWEDDRTAVPCVFTSPSLLCRSRWWCNQGLEKCCTICVSLFHSVLCFFPEKKTWKRPEWSETGFLNTR